MKKGRIPSDLVPLPGQVSVFFRAGTSTEDAVRVIVENGAKDPLLRSRSLGTGYFVEVPVGEELAFADKFSKLLEVDDATVEYIKKAKIEPKLTIVT